jgi:hypothetical protein
MTHSSFVQPAQLAVSKCVSQCGVLQLRQLREAVFVQMMQMAGVLWVL